MTVPRDYHGADATEPDRSVLLDQLVDRLEDYRAVVHRCPATDLATTIAAVLTARAAGRQTARFVVPPGLDRDWLGGVPATGAVSVVTDTADAPLDAATLDQLDGVVTACTVAIAQTGTIVLDASPDQGRRIISLIPDYHLVIVRAAQVVATVPHGLARLAPTRPLTMISGPSATSDIELTRVEGVHGPRALEVVVVD
jgi:L-lactate dehydrogenase complex protein LldG